MYTAKRFVLTLLILLHNSPDLALAVPAKRTIEVTEIPVDRPQNIFHDSKENRRASEQVPLPELGLTRANNPLTLKPVKLSTDNMGSRADVEIHKGGGAGGHGGGGHSSGGHGSTSSGGREGTSSSGRGGIAGGAVGGVAGGAAGAVAGPHGSNVTSNVAAGHPTPEFFGMTFFIGVVGLMVV